MQGRFQMSNRSTSTIATKEKSSVMPMRSSLIQRQCACGNSAGMTGECSDCQNKSLVQRKSIDRDNTSEVSPIAHEFPLQTKLTVGKPGDIYEQEADRVASQVMSMGNSSPSIQPATAIGRKEVQTNRSSDGEAQVGSSIESRLSSSKGGGSPLPDGVRSFMEPRFGADFSQVRVHTGNDTVQMNRELGAQAFTHGSDIYYGDENAPGNNNITAHELTHTIQQKSSFNSIQRALQSPRFSETPDLESAKDDKKHLQKNSTGLSVRILQQALLDIGYSLPKYGVDGVFGEETEIAVKEFQKANSINDDGIVGSKTMQLLDISFLDHGVMASIPQGQVPSTAPTEGVEWNSAAIPAELLKGTRALNGEEKAEVERRRTTEVQAPKGGALPIFKMNITTHTDNYEKRVEDKTNQEIDYLYNLLAKNKASDRKDPNKLYGWNIIEKIAAISKKETDRVFGNYAKGKPFKVDLNLFDAWEEKEKEFSFGGIDYEKDSLEWRVEKIFGGQNVGGISQQHGAVQSRAIEKEILDRVKNRIIVKRKSELIEIHKGWPGFEDEGKVYLQRFVASDNTKNRDEMWVNFQKIVHEYIHTLEHSKHNKYGEVLDELKGGKTYREGMTEYFTKIVLESTIYDDQLREDVEGSYHNSLVKHIIPKYFGYDEAKNAEAVVGVIGIRNAMAAFFAGRIDLIGG
jgi:hypothetical protein